MQFYSLRSTITLQCQSVKSVSERERGLCILLHYITIAWQIFLSRVTYSSGGNQSYSQEYKDAVSDFWYCIDTVWSCILPLYYTFFFHTEITREGSWIAPPSSTSWDSSWSLNRGMSAESPWPSFLTQSDHKHMAEGTNELENTVHRQAEGGKGCGEYLHFYRYLWI